MKHAGAGTLEALAPLLADIRALGRFREPRPGVFYLAGRAALHFHEDPAGPFADYRMPGDPDFTRASVATPEDRAALLVRLLSPKDA